MPSAHALTRAVRVARAPIGPVLLALLAGCAAGGGGSRGTAGAAPDRAPQVERVRLEQAGVNVVDNTVTTDQYVSSHSIAAAPERAFAALVGTYQEVGLAVAGAQSGQRTVDSGAMRLHRRLGKVPLSRFVDCGSSAMGANADSYEVTLRVRSSLAPDAADGAMLHTSVVATSVAPGNGMDRVHCSTTGVLESQLARRLEQRAVKG